MKISASDCGQTPSRLIVNLLYAGSSDSLSPVRPEAQGLPPRVQHDITIIRTTLYLCQERALIIP